MQSDTMAKPLYERIKAQIVAEWLGDLQQGESLRLPSERELEAHYQVSRVTISKALALLVAEGLLSKRPRSGYFATRTPVRPLESANVPRLLGYVAPLAGEELVQRVFRGIDRVAHSKNYRVLMGNAGNNLERERDAVQDLLTSGAMGTILMPVPRRTAWLPTDYLCTDDFDVPFVLVDTCLPEQGHTQIVFDNYRAGYAMMERLLLEGHRSIGILSYDEEIAHRPLGERLRGYKNALLDHHLPPQNVSVRRFDSYSDHVATVAAILKEWLDCPHPPTAIIAVEDINALLAIEFLEAHGVHVPEDICVVGFDNRTAARSLRPAFTTTAPDFERMGELACETLIGQIETGNVSRNAFVLEAPILHRTTARIERSHRAFASR